MKEEEFKRLRAEVLRKVGLVNMQLRNKRSLEESLKLNDITEEQLTLFGWEYNKVTNVVERVNYITYKDFKENNLVIVEDERAINNYAETEIIKDLDKEKLKDLIDNYTVISQMVQMFKENQNIQLNSNNIVIELPQEDDKSFKVSYRVNKTIHNQFKEFCKEHKEFTAKDLLSMALKEYMDKYK